jgi:hypothetical protein
MDHPSSQRRLPIERTGEINEPELLNIVGWAIYLTPDRVRKNRRKGVQRAPGGESDIADETKHRQLRVVCLPWRHVDKATSV